MADLLTTGGWMAVVLAWLGVSVAASIVLSVSRTAVEADVKTALIFPFELLAFLLLLLPYHVVVLVAILPVLYLLWFVWKAFVYVLFHRMRTVAAILITIVGIAANAILVFKAIHEVFNDLPAISRVVTAFTLTTAENLLGLVFWDACYRLLLREGQAQKQRVEALFTASFVTIFLGALLWVDYGFQRDMVRMTMEVVDEGGMTASAGVTAFFPMLSVLIPMGFSLVAFLVGRLEGPEPFRCEVGEMFAKKWLNAWTVLSNQVCDIPGKARQCVVLLFLWPYFMVNGILGPADAKQG